MPKLIINGNEIHCYRDEKLSKYDCNYYFIAERKIFGDFLDVHSENILIREEYNEALNSITLSIGHYDYLDERFYPMFDFCDGYDEEINFGNIIWRQ